MHWNSLRRRSPLPAILKSASLPSPAWEHDTRYFANNNARHFAFNAEERFLPIYQFASEANKKISGLHEFADAFLGKCTLGQAAKPTAEWRGWQAR